MPVQNQDIGFVVQILANHCCRVSYGVLGAAVSRRVCNPEAVPASYGNATVTMLNAYFGGMAPQASWVVGENGYPTNYGQPPGPNYAPNWSTATPHYDNVDNFLAWLDDISPDWHIRMRQ